MNTDLVKKTNKLINGRNEITILNYTCDSFTVLIYNHLKNKDNEQHKNIILVRCVNGYDNENEIVIPDTVDTQYQIIIIRTLPISIYTEILNKSQSYTITITLKCLNSGLFENNLYYFKQLYINNKRYHLISRFTNSNDINEVFLVGGTDQRLVSSFFKVIINQKIIFKTNKSIQKYVYKKINYKDNQKSYERVVNEIKSMKLLKGNQRFVQLVDYHHDKDNQIFHIITEYCDGGDLAQMYKHLIDLNLIFKESDIIKYISDLFNILLDLDKHGIVHCDIKPSNIFIDKFYSTLILGDFGCCKFIDKSTIIEYQDTKEYLQETSDFNSKCIDHELSEPTIVDMNSNTLINATRGTIGYISPEAMKRQYAQSCDIFSIGSTILKLLCCHPDDRNNHQLFQSNGEIKISECRYSKQLIEFIHRLLDRSPKNRESLNQLLNQYIETITNNCSITFNLNTPFHNTSVNVTEINFGNEFNQILSIGVLPESLKSLVFGYKFNQILSVGVLPKSLLTLKLGCSFNQILPVGVLPESLKSLRFESAFNQILSVGVLPESLQSLVFGGEFNQILSVGVLPKSLLTLSLGYSFNQILSVVGVLPESLESLTMKRYNHRIKRGVLQVYESENEAQILKPIESLIIGAVNDFMKSKLPSDLKFLSIGPTFSEYIFEAYILTNSHESLQFIKEYYPGYYSRNNLCHSSLNSPIYQILGEYITALLLTDTIPSRNYVVLRNHAVYACLAEVESYSVNVLDIQRYEIFDLRIHKKTKKQASNSTKQRKLKRREKKRERD
ncbi:hypothetical protein PPL_12120 [Heterostelium album PN500]|uniref:Protein kinase domain-containing protein n=1 Tax=Heterostelium pallidum (strain ATCC 26659 / Pp 5 / PN500) TaxID=670386 RepID=D3BLR7_HETP5|nr:hypothetical protein PPL_12120 [Heterostelium album PN500]EFA77518.1 hypothetical protein PPL_12120 [Heterostelium album PN500]|eukprot:XP_020429646.1 hypothetical protein PPL_12120 [Heterostelium album PN500]